eukprot:5913336-Amphidinium_carterae.1
MKGAAPFLADHSADQVGFNPFLSTMRSRLLLELVESKSLCPSPSGMWNVRSCIAPSGQVVQYNLHLWHEPPSGIGSSTLAGVESVDWIVEGSTLVIRQTAVSRVYTCRCQLSQDMRSVHGGTWRASDSDLKGTFTATRASELEFTDSNGLVWDSATHLIKVLSRLDSELALDKLSMFAANLEVQHLASAPSEMVVDSAGFAMADPFVSHALWRRLIKSAGSLSSLETKAIVQLLHCCALATSELDAMSSDTRWRDVCRALQALQDPAGRIQHEEHDWIYSAITWWKQSGWEANTSAMETTMSALLAAGTSREHRVAVETLLTVLVSESFPRSKSVLEASMQLLAQLVERHEIQWTHRHLMQVLVHSAVQLQEACDANIRKMMTPFLLRLISQDAWSHLYVVSNFFMHFGK